MGVAPLLRRIHIHHRKQAPTSSPRRCRDRSRVEGRHRHPMQPFDQDLGRQLDAQIRRKTKTGFQTWTGSRRRNHQMYSNVEVMIYAAEDYTHAEQRIAFLKADRSFMISTIADHMRHVSSSPTCSGSST